MFFGLVDERKQMVVRISLVIFLVNVASCLVLIFSVSSLLALVSAFCRIFLRIHDLS